MLHYCRICQAEVEVNYDPDGNQNICSRCGAVLARFDLPAGTIINGFMVEKLLGRGGMGVVYKAKQINLERHVALKVLSNALSNDLEFVDRFFKEARSAASLSHANIVQAYDAGATPEGIYYFAMELVDGETIERMIERLGRIPVRTAISIAASIAEALHYAWDRQRLSHGDIKPENIILNTAGEAKLADLGLAKNVHDDLRDQDILATPLYAAPELIRGEHEKIGIATDMYAFGATLYTMLAGKPPFDGDDSDEIMKRHLEEQPVPLDGTLRDVDSELSRFVDSLLAKEIEKRPKSWRDIARFLCARRDSFMTGNFNLRYLAKPQVRDPWRIWALRLAVVAALLLVITATYVLVVETRDVRRGPSPVSATTDAPHDSAVENTEKTSMVIAGKGADGSGAVGDRQGQVETVSPLPGRTKAEEHFLEREGKMVEFLTPNSKLVNFSNEELQRVRSEIHAIMEDGKHLPSVAVSSQNLRFFEDCLKMIHEIRKGREQKAENEKIARVEERRKEKRRIEQERSLENQRRDAELETWNRELKAYFQALKDVLDPAATKRITPFKTSMNDILSRNPPEEIRAKCEFAVRRLSNPLALKEILLRYPDALKDQSIPSKKMPPDCRIDSVNEEAIRFYTLADGKKIVIKVLYWDKLLASDHWMFLQYCFLASGKSQTFTEEEQHAILAQWVLASCPPLGKNLLSEFAKIGESDRGQWAGLIRDATSCSDELAASSLWDSLAAMKREGRSVDVARGLKDMERYRETSFYQGNWEGIRDLAGEFSGTMLNEEVELWLRIQAKCLAAGNARDALHMASTIQNRYGYRPEVNAATQKKIGEAVSASVDALMEKSPIRSLKDNKIPFYFWEYDQPGDAQIFLQIIRSLPQVSEDAVLMRFLNLAAAVDSGDWQRAKTEFSKVDRDELRSFAAMKSPFRTWMPALVFGYGFLAGTFGHEDAVGMVLDILARESSADADPKMVGVVAPLYMQLAILSRVPSKAVGQIDALGPAKLANPNLTVRILLLDLVTSLRNRDPEMFLRRASEFPGRFEGAGFDDPSWVALAAKMVKGESVGDETLKKLRDAACVSSPLCAQVLLDATAFSVATGRQSAGTAIRILPLIQSKVDGNVMSGPLWWDWLTASLAVAESFDAMKQTVVTALEEEWRIGSIRYYPLLKLLEFSLDANSGGTSARETAVPSLRGIPCATEAESGLFRIVASTDSAREFGKILPSLHPRNAFWCGIAVAIAGARNDASASRDVLVLLNERLGDRLLPSERLLLKSLEEKIR